MEPVGLGANRDCALLSGVQYPNVDRSALGEPLMVVWRVQALCSVASEGLGRLTL
jgi:hypothetical protein